MARATRPAAGPAAPLRLLGWTAFWVFLIDQATKWFVVHWLDLAHRLEIAVWPGVLMLRMAWNRGVNFGILADFDLRWVLVALAVAISLAVVVWIAREGGSRLARVSAGLLVGGALGNVVDRVLYGAVADFVNLPFFGDWVGALLGGDRQWSFNVADIAVVAGALGLVLFGGGRAAPRGGRAKSG